MIAHAAAAPRLPRKHLLAVSLIGKMNLITRNGLGDAEELEGLIDTVMDLIRTECLPYSEVCAVFATAMGFYFAEVEQDREETVYWTGIARKICEKRCPEGLDFIENAVIPSAVMYLDLGDYAASENMLLEGILICEEHADLAACRRMKHDLHRYMLDVFCESGDSVRARELLADLDEERDGYPDTVQKEMRDFLSTRFDAG